MSETEKEEKAEIDAANEDKIIKLGKTGKILIYSSITIVWFVVAGLGIRDIWIGKGFLETPWILFGLILSVVIVVLIIIPLFRSLKTDVQKYKEEKEKKEKQF